MSMQINEKVLEKMLHVATEAAREAGRIAVEKWRKPLQTSSKGFRDIVTDADVAAQKAITDMIGSAFPEHGYVTEEDDSALPSDGSVTWVIDPIDGTTNYSRHLPDFCVSVAAVANGIDGVDRGDVLVGVIYDPVRNELFSAVAGGGCLVNGQPVKSSTCKELSEAIVALDWSHSQENRQATLESLSRFAHQVNTIRAEGSAALVLAWIAAGRIDCYMNYNLKRWDIAAGYLLIKEAGGQITDMAQRDWTMAGHTGDCVATNGLLHALFMATIA